MRRRKLEGRGVSLYRAVGGYYAQVDSHFLKFYRWPSRSYLAWEAWLLYGPGGPHTLGRFPSLDAAVGWALYSIQDDSRLFETEEAR
jgi:hypothetical protein